MNPFYLTNWSDAEQELINALALPFDTVRQMDYKFCRAKACHERAAQALNLCRIDLLTHHVGELKLSSDAADKGSTVEPQERNRTETVAGKTCSKCGQDLHGVFADQAG